MLNIKVATESQPFDPAKVESIYVPAIVKLLVFQLYGNKDGQMLSVVMLLSIAFMLSANTATESQPVELISVESV
jgi:hypothetical protein